MFIDHLLPLDGVAGHTAEHSEADNEPGRSETNGWVFTSTINWIGQTTMMLRARRDKVGSSALKSEVASRSTVHLNKAPYSVAANVTKFLHLVHSATSPTHTSLPALPPTDAPDVRSSYNLLLKV